MRLFAALFLPAIYVAAAAPCTTPTPGCTERVPLGPEGRFSVVYRSHPLTQPDPAIRRALIVIHGIGRNADWYFASAMASSFLAGALNDTVVVSPRFASSEGPRCNDSLAGGEISWTCSGWNIGEAPRDLPAVFSYQLIDELLRRFADRKLFPSLATIVVSGHSAGGQFVHRYLAATAVPDQIQVPIRFVVSNPSSYLYLDTLRPAPGMECSPDKDCKGEFAEPAAASCAAFNRWRYGLEQRAGYAAEVPDGDLRSRLISRRVVYLLGELDNLPGGSLDMSCGGMAQGPNRLARGLSYLHYIRSRYKAAHEAVIVPACGHNARCMFTGDPALPALFPRAP